MKCPVSSCKYEIDDDSVFCDQCGAELSVCPKCGAVAAAKFCPKDGTRLESRKTRPAAPPAAPPVAQTAAEAPSQPAAAPSADARATVRLNDTAVSAFRIRHSSGAVVEVSHGDIVGRSDGKFAAVFGGSKFVSGRHASFSAANGLMAVTDLGSTNGTKVNGESLAPNAPRQLKSGDKVTFADQEMVIL